MSNFAFGTYRISDYNLQHIEALKQAISSGISMIDTSTNYMDGGAERAVALALNEFASDITSKIQIVSKFGYIQGTNLQKHKKTPFEEVVQYSESCFHSISKSFLKEQLSESLSRLHMKTLDCYLIHNPEYYLLDAINRGISKDERLDEMYKRIYNAFVGLEEEVKIGRIKSYGISSNSFSKPANNEEYLPYEDLVTLASSAALQAGNSMHHFTTIQLPINLLEREGLKCASWAKKNGLRVLVNRPLNAMHNNLMYRLADCDESREYYRYLNELMELSENEIMMPLYNFLEQLDANKHKFGWIGDYDSFLYSHMIPHIKKTLVAMDEKYRELMLDTIDIFLQEYRKMVEYECSKKSRIILKDFFEDCPATMQECAINFLKKNNNIDYVLVGMRKPSYVSEILSL
ncbi:aldo/keto reductase [bacterium]|nr:aldo/keto reductase [bacterium]MBU1993667.1 aldo/keto reductase [bacterium]